MSESVAFGAEPLVSVGDLEVCFESRMGRRNVLERIWLEVPRGRIVGVVGESGSGKTVMARTMMGMLPATATVTAGRMRFGELECDLMSGSTSVAGLRGRRMSMVFQNAKNSLNPLMTVETQVLRVLSRQRPGASPAELREGMLALLRSVDLREVEAVASKYPHQLSGGMAQRVVLALAIACEPELLIADEPTTALDVTTQAEILALMRQLSLQNSMSILLISHDLGVISELCETVIVMHAGHIVERGAVAQVLGRPAHPYTAALLDSIPRVDGGQRLRTIPGAVPDLLDPPKGCRFKSRCPYAREGCDEYPGERSIAPGHAVNCLLYEAEGSTLERSGTPSEVRR